MRLPTSVLLIPAILFGLAACGGPVKGSGKVGTKTLPAAGKFAVLRVDAPMPVEVTVTSGAEASVRAEADDNLAETFHAEVADGRLRVWSEATWTTTNPCRLTITVPSIGEASVAGAVSATIDALRGDVAKLDADGASRLTVALVEAKSAKVGARGKCAVTFTAKLEKIEARARGFSTITANVVCADANLIAEGASHIDGVVTKRANCMTTGTSQILLDCAEHLQASAMATSKILYGGEPKVEGEVGEAAVVDARPKR